MRKEHRSLYSISEERNDEIDAEYEVNNDLKNMRVSYIGNTPAFQAGKVGSIPTTRSILKYYKLIEIWS